MFHLASTRFINATYEENLAYREKHNEVALYGTLIKIQCKYMLGAIMFVIEMNNEKNMIEGIGLIKNNQLYDKQYKIYKNNDYNRCIYRGYYWISREDILRFDYTIIDICDLILFKGKSHLKRQTGITVLTEKLFTNWPYELHHLKHKIKTLFISTFRDISCETKTMEITEADTFEIIPKKKKLISSNKYKDKEIDIKK